MDSLDDAWRESERRRQEVAVRNLTFPDMELKEIMKEFSKEFREKGQATLKLPEHIKRKEERDSLYILQPVLNHYRELRGAPLIYLF